MEPLASADPKGREGQRASSGYHSCYAVDPVMKGHEDGGNMFFGMEEALLPGSNRSPGQKALSADILRKEVIQPQVPLRLPCYDFTPVAEPTVVSCLPLLG